MLPSPSTFFFGNFVCFNVNFPRQDFSLGDYIDGIERRSELFMGSKLIFVD